MLARLFATISVAALLLAVTMISASDAGFRRLRSSYVPGEVITAHSHYGNGTIQSVVRPGRYGWQVKLPIYLATATPHSLAAATERCRANAASSAASTGNTRSKPVRV